MKKSLLRIMAVVLIICMAVSSMAFAGNGNNKGPVEITEKGRIYTKCSSCIIKVPFELIAVKKGSDVYVITKNDLTDTEKDLVKTKIIDTVSQYTNGSGSDYIQYATFASAPEGMEYDAETGILTFSGTSKWSMLLADDIPAADSPVLEVVVLYNVSYVITNNGEEGFPEAEVPATIATAAGITITVADVPAEEGYTFNGWTVSAGGVTIDSGTFDMPEADVELVGYWTKNETSGSGSLGDTKTKYPVTYEFQGDVPEGRVAPTEANQEENAEVTVEPVPDEVEGYTFEGWSTEDAAIEEGKFVMPAKAVKLIGTWTKINLGGGGGGDYEPKPIEHKKDDEKIIEDEDAPLAGLPDEKPPVGGGDEDTETIEDPELPFADVPFTGDSAALYLGAAIVSLGAVALCFKKKEQ